MAIIDRNIRKWSKIPAQSKCFTKFVNTHNLHPLKHAIMMNNEIDWDATSKWIHHNLLTTPTSNKLSKIQSHWIKSLTFSLPTAMGDLQKQNYPDLYLTDNIICPLCTSSHSHDNQHIGLCSHQFDTLKVLFNKHKKILIDTLHQHFNTILKSKIDIRVNRSHIFLYFDTATDATGIHMSHPIYLILHNFIPTQLTYLFDLFISKHKTYISEIIKFFHNLHKDLYNSIWKPYKNNLKQLEKLWDITKTKKRNYQKK